MRLCALLVLSVLVAACDSSTESFVFDGTSPSGQAIRAQRTGMVYLARVVPGATVQVLPVDGDKVLHSTTTTEVGIFHLPENLALPDPFRVVAFLPDGQTVEAQVSGETRYIWVNAISNLISLARRTDPDLTLAQADAFVRAGLGFPANSPPSAIYGLGSGPGSPFSHTEFLTQAGAGGGIDAFSRSLLAAFSQGEVKVFRTTSLSNSLFLQTTNRALAQGIRAQDKEEGSLVGTLVSSLGGPLLGTAVNDVAGRILASFGLSVGAGKAFSTIESDLDTISNQLNALSEQLTSATELQLASDLAISLNKTISDLESVVKALFQNAKSAATLYGPDSTVVDHGISSVPSSVNSALTEVGQILATDSKSSLLEVLTSTTKSNNLSSLYASLLASSPVTINYNGESTKFSDSSPPASLSYYDLREDTRTGILQSNLIYYSAWAQFANMVFAENASAKYLPQTVSEQGFNPPAPALGSAILDISGLNNGLHKALQQVPEPCGTDLVLIDALNGKMWYLPTDVVTYPTAQNDCVNLTLNGWYNTYGVPEQCPTDPKQAGGFTRPSNQTGWRVPEITELDLLYDRVKAAGGTGSNTEQSMKNLGFGGLSSSSSNYKKVWYNGALVASSEKDGAPSPFYYDMSEGKTNNDTFVSDNPSYTAIYVRNIPDFSYNDTPEQANNSYNTIPSAIKLTSSQAGNSSVNILNLVVQGTNFDPTNNPRSTSDLTSRTQFTLSNGSITSFPSLPVMGTDVAHLLVAGDSVQLVFDAPGSVTVTCLYRTAIGGQTFSTSQVFSNTISPALQSIMVSPQNLDIQTLQANNTQQFYCTGYTASGKPVDLTSAVTWQLQDSNGNPIPSSSAFFNANSAGDLVFQTANQPISIMTVVATYTAGSVADATWTDQGQGQTSTAVFAVPSP